MFKDSSYDASGDSPLTSFDGQQPKCISISILYIIILARKFSRQHMKFASYMLYTTSGSIKCSDIALFPKIFFTTFLLSQKSRFSQIQENLNLLLIYYFHQAVVVHTKMNQEMCV